MRLLRYVFGLMAFAAIAAGGDPSLGPEITVPATPGLPQGYLAKYTEAPGTADSREVQLRIARQLKFDFPGATFTRMIDPRTNRVRSLKLTPDPEAIITERLENGYSHDVDCRLVALKMITNLVDYTVQSDTKSRKVDNGLAHFEVQYYRKRDPLQRALAAKTLDRVIVKHASEGYDAGFNCQQMVLSYPYAMDESAECGQLILTYQPIAERAVTIVPERWNALLNPADAERCRFITDPAERKRECPKYSDFMSFEAFESLELVRGCGLSRVQKALRADAGSRPGLADALDRVVDDEYSQLQAGATDEPQEPGPPPSFYQKFKAPQSASAPQ